MSTVVWGFDERSKSSQEASVTQILSKNIIKEWPGKREPSQTCIGLKNILVQKKKGIKVKHIELWNLRSWTGQNKSFKYPLAFQTYPFFKYLFSLPMKQINKIFHLYLLIYQWHYAVECTSAVLLNGIKDCSKAIFNLEAIHMSLLHKISHVTYFLKKWLLPFAVYPIRKIISHA